VMNEWSIRMAGLVGNRGARQRFRREDGTYFMKGNGVIPQEGSLIRAAQGLWSRSRIVYRVQLDEATLLYDAAADSLARRAIPRASDPRR
jgi:hypothetical protein